MSSEPGLQTVARAIQLLRCFEGGKEVLSLADLTRIMGLNKVTVFRLASTLVAEGLLVHDRESSRYRMSFGVIALGRELLDRDGLRDCAHRHMESSRSRTDETVCLSVREAWDQVVIHTLPSRQPVRYVLEVASRGRIYNGAAGQCLMVDMPDHELEALIAETGLEPSTAESIVLQENLLQKLTGICRHGYGMSVGERIVDAAAVAAPVHGEKGSVVASLSIVMPRSRADRTHLHNCAAVAAEAAQTISREIGYQGSPYAVIEAVR